jgi:hypothetical protein
MMNFLVVVGLFDGSAIGVPAVRAVFRVALYSVLNGV